MAATPKTYCDLSITKVINMDGEQLPGVQKFSVNYDVDDIKTIVKVEIVIAKDSLTIIDDVISFDTLKKRKE